MKKYMGILKQTQLFSGVREEEILTMLSCLGAVAKSFQKGETVLRQGERLSALPLLVEGQLLLQKEDYWGNRSILGNVMVGELFGEAYLAPMSGELSFDVVAESPATVIFMDANHLLTTCSHACRFHAMTVQNLFFALCRKNKKLVQKIEHISRRCIREKLMSYLSQEAKGQHSSYFTIPYNRQQLADFLAVDRSAMSNELSKMRDEGLISFEKNRFQLL